MSDKLPDYTPKDYAKSVEKKRKILLRRLSNTNRVEVKIHEVLLMISHSKKYIDTLKMRNINDWIFFSDFVEELKTSYYFLIKHKKKFDWLLLFKDIKIDEDFVPETQAHVLNTLEDKENFYSASVFNLTFQMLYNFKCDVYFHSNETKLKYIDNHFKDEPKQKSPEKDFKVTEASIYQAKLNFKHFLECYKAELLNTVKPEQPEKETEQETIEIKPVLKPEAVKMVFDILKDFFSPEHQTELKQILETGNNASKKLLFKGNGNRLTDTFKKLIAHDFITGCQKQDLINWIISNFTFTHRNLNKAFLYDTVEKIISRNGYPCKSPLIEIKGGQIQRFEQPRMRKRNKY